MAEQGPLTVIATDLTKTVEDIVAAVLGVASVGGKTVSSLMDAGAEIATNTLPEDAPLVGGVVGLVEHLTVSVLKAGGKGGQELSALSERVHDYVTTGRA